MLPWKRVQESDQQAATFRRGREKWLLGSGAQHCLHWKRTMQPSGEPSFVKATGPSAKRAERACGGLSAGVRSERLQRRGIERLGR